MSLTTSHMVQHSFTCGQSIYIRSAHRDGTKMADCSLTFLPKAHDLSLTSEGLVAMKTPTETCVTQAPKTVIVI